MLPLLLSWAYGCLTTLGDAGLIGTASSSILGPSNWLGDAALPWGVGVQLGQLAACETFTRSSGPATAWC